MDRPGIAIDVGRVATANGMPGFGTLAINTIDEFVDGKFDLLGYSWGGLLAQEVAHRRSRQISHLVLAATAPSWPCWPPTYAAYRGMQSSDRTPEHLIKIAAELYGGDEIRKNPELVVELGIARDTDDEAYERQHRAAMTCWYNAARLMLIRQRTLIMAGDDDPITPYMNALVMRAGILRSQLHTEHNGGHLFLMTRPKKSAKRINEFLDTNRKLALAA